MSQKNTIVKVSVFSTQHGNSLTFKVPSEHQSLLNYGNFQQVLAYALGERVTISGKTYQRKPSANEARNLAMLRQETSDGNCSIRINGQIVNLRDPMRKYLEERLMSQEERLYIIRPSDGREVPLYGGSQTLIERRVVGERNIEGITIEGDFWPITRKTFPVIKNAAAVPKSEMNRYQPFLYAEIEVGHKLIS